MIREPLTRKLSEMGILCHVSSLQGERARTIADLEEEGNREEGRGDDELDCVTIITCCLAILIRILQKFRLESL